MNNQKAEKIILTFIVFSLIFWCFISDVSAEETKDLNSAKEKYISAKLPTANIKLIAENNYGNITIIRFKDCETSRNILFESCHLRTMIINSKKLNAFIAIQK